MAPAGSATIDLSGLSAAERRVLGMLAAGHTVKSSSAEAGLSIYAINERLREARRKTGVGSSRELARLLAGQPSPPQEMIPEENEVPPSIPSLQPASVAPSHGAVAPAGGLYLMVVLVLAGLSAVILSAHQQANRVLPPKIVSTAPAQGARIAPGRYFLSVTFDRPMAADRYSFTTPEGPSAYPDCPGRPVLSSDARTYSMMCVARSGRSYAVGFNGGRFRNFVSAAGHVPAEPGVLRFSAR